MKITNSELISSLQTMLIHAISKAKVFNDLSIDELKISPSEGAWCILECLEHLNLYGDFYIPEIQKRMKDATEAQSGSYFKSGLLGNYFAELMLVKDGKMTTMSSPKDKNPKDLDLNKKTIQKFIHQCGDLSQILEKALKVDLTKTKTAISLSPFIKLRLGDTLRVVIYHIDRHVAQADRILI